METQGASLRYAELLRTLGQELGREGARPGHIQYDGHGLRVLATLEGPDRQDYDARGEPDALSRERRGSRTVALHPHRPRWFFCHFAGDLQEVTGRRWPRR